MSPALLLVLSLQAASPAQASPSSAAPSSAPAPAPALPDDKESCRREQVTGSHFPVTTCMTESEWRRRDQQNQQDLSQQRTLNGPR